MRPDRLAICALVLPAALLAQTAGTVAAVTDLHVAPDGRVLASMKVGAPVQTLSQKSGWSQVAVEGWLHVSVIGPKRDSFAVSVKSPNGALMRAIADRNGAVVALVEDGMGLQQLQRTDQWAHVRRVGWVLTKDVKPGAGSVPVAAKPPASITIVTKPPAPPAAPPTVPPESLPGDVSVARRTAILTAPSGATLGTLDSATRLVTGAAERGWVKVTLEGWVREADLLPLDSAPISSVSAADLRADPARYKGRTVRWVVQVMAFQTADPLRKGLAPDESYLLARGPGSESSLLYLTLPPPLIELGKSLKPLSTVVVLARVRSGKSEPSGVPILDVLRIIQR